MLLVLLVLRTTSVASATSVASFRYLFAYLKIFSNVNALMMRGVTTLAASSGSPERGSFARFLPPKRAL